MLRQRAGSRSGTAAVAKFRKIEQRSWNAAAAAARFRFAREAERVNRHNRHVQPRSQAPARRAALAVVRRKHLVYHA